MQRSTEKWKVDTAKSEKQSTDEEEDHIDAGHTFDKTKVPWLRNEWKQYVLYPEHIIYEWMKNEKILVEHHDKNLEW